MTHTATKPDNAKTATSKGGSKAINQLLTNSAAIPLFIPQTFINSLRDVGYNSTTSALCEHVDNAIQAGADEIRIYFNQTGKRGAHEIDTLVYDNGKGMAPSVLQICMSFGGSMSYNERSGIGRFGVGMKTSALSMSPVLDVYSWVEPEAVYSMSMDVNEIASMQKHSLSLPEPKFVTKIPDEISEIMSSKMVYPKSNQDLLASSKNRVADNFGKSGTIVYMPNCDRLSYKTSRSLVEHATSEMSRVYREFMNQDLKIFINNRLLKPSDPTYWMKGARHAEQEVLADCDEKYSKLVNSWEIQIPLNEDSKETAPVSVRLYKLPYESWKPLGKQKLKKIDLYDNHLLTIMRNEREVFAGVRSDIFKFHGEKLWSRVRIDFSGELDEAFGVAMNKQGIRPMAYVGKHIQREIESDLTRLKNDYTKWVAKDKADNPDPGKLSDAERRAQNAEGHQPKSFPNPKVETQAEIDEIDANIRGMAIKLKRAAETDEEAFLRIKNSKYIMDFIHDGYHPFYDIEAKLGKVILTINKAHPFYTDLYQPLSDLVAQAINKEEQEDEIDETSAEQQKNMLATLQMMFFSLGRTQTILQGSDPEGSKEKLFKQLHIEWSKALETQLQTK